MSMEFKHVGRVPADSPVLHVMLLPAPGERATPAAGCVLTDPHYLRQCSHLPASTGKSISSPADRMRADGVWFIQPKGL